MENQTQQPITPPQEPPSTLQQFPIFDERQHKKQIIKYGLLAILGAIAALFITGIAIYYALKPKSESRSLQTPISVSTFITPTIFIKQTVSCEDLSEAAPDVSLPPMINKLKYEGEPVSYPDDWPNAVRYPKEFLLMDPVSGSLAGIGGDNSTGYAAALLYKGNVSDAVQLMGEFMKSNGYTLECTKMQSWKYLLVVDKNHKGGAITFEEDLEEKDITRIIATVFPE